MQYSKREKKFLAAFYATIMDIYLYMIKQLYASKNIFLSGGVIKRFHPLYSLKSGLS